MTAAFTLGVIGHVDHGKTALVRALTGAETDRLKEERERGLSIALGFAFLETPAGTIDLIDVPGHEDFVRTMIGGATGIDGVVLCVAANEGVMPQTVEHFNIARLLGVANGIVVITKTDLVEPDALERVHEQVREFVRGSFLAGAPAIDVAAVSGIGIRAVRQALADCRHGAMRQDAGGGYFLPLDRAFTMRGFGVVVTGTLRGGPLRTGDAVEIMPAGREATVRGLQIHNRPVEQALPGQRVAANLRNVDRVDVRRGDVLSMPGTVVASTRLDVLLQLLPRMPAIKSGAMLRFLTGTSEAMVRVRLLDRKSLEPGEETMAQLTLDRAIATRPEEPYLVRSVSPLHTIGGGTILAVNPGRHRRYDSAVMQRLQLRASGNLEQILAQRLEEAGARGLRLEALAGELGADSAALRDVAVQTGAMELEGDLVAAARVLDELSAAVLEAVDRFHAANPLRSGLDAGTLVSDWLDEWQPDADVVRYVLNRLAGEGRLSRRGQTVSRAGHDAFARLPEAERVLVASMEQQFRACGIEAIPPDTVTGTSRKRQVIFRLLLESGRLVRLRTYDRAARMVLHAASLDEAVQSIERAFPWPAAFAAKDVRDLLGSTRKYVVPLMEHLDASGITVRSGDMRRLRQHASDEGGATQFCGR